MIAAVIRWSLANRVLVLIAALLLTGWGVHSLVNTPVDAIPDLSDVQVIIRTSFPGQSPRVVEDQVTYPLTTAMLAVPKAVTVRGFSFFGDSYVYVIFEDGTDIYWARSRVLEYLNQAGGRLPPSVRPQLGPDATGVGWVYSYVLVDRSGTHDLADLRSLQDWFLKFELESVPGVAEVATVGGMVRQYQVSLDPGRLRAHGLGLGRVRDAVKRANMETGGSVLEMGEAEYMVRASGYLENIDDLRQIPLGVGRDGVPLLLADVADITTGPQMRRGIADLDGEGEVTGGIVVMRWGENAVRTIDAVRTRLDALARSLPDDVEIVTTYDRSSLIQRAVSNLGNKLLMEFAIVVAVCALFLFHLRSALVIVVSLPIGILAAFVIMRLQGINANIMSLGGIALAIGTMVDAAIVLTENVHKRLEEAGAQQADRWSVILQASVRVGPPVFFSLLIITLSFLPVFTLQAQEGRLFAPLAWTKTWAMAAAAALSVTLVPVLMGYFVRGRVRREEDNPVNRLVLRLYAPVVTGALRYPRTVVAVALGLVAVGLWPLTQLGSEFMPPLDEGDLMYMPTTRPGISVGKARQLLQQTDRLIRTVPEVRRVFGKIGRADTATDPAPLTMIETLIQFKPRSEWRPGLTPAALREELDRRVRVPGLTNAWVMPIRTRIDMLATGVKTPVGVRVSGPDLTVIEDIGRQLETVLADVPGTASVYAERVTGGRYVDVDVDRQAAARYGLNIADVHDVIGTAVGGMTVTETVEGLKRFPVNLRYPQHVRDSVAALSVLPLVSPSGAQLALADVSRISITGGPPVIKSENARRAGWVFVDIDGRDIGSYVNEAQRAVIDRIDLPAEYAIAWSGQYEYMVRALARLKLVAPVTLAVIVVLLYMCFRRFSDVALVLGTLPLAMIGGLWLVYLLDYRLSVAVGVGFIALAGLAVEIGVVMLVYLNEALARRRERSPDGALSLHEVTEAVREGAMLRVRPVVMTVAATMAGLLPVMLGSGTGSELMQRVAAPMTGGMVSAIVLTLVVLPAVYLLAHRSHIRTAH